MCRQGAVDETESIGFLDHRNDPTHGVDVADGQRRAHCNDEAHGRRTVDAEHQAGSAMHLPGPDGFHGGTEGLVAISETTNPMISTKAGRCNDRSGESDRSVRECRALCVLQ